MISLILTCEHYSSLMPQKWQPFFLHMEDRLLTHEGWDEGAPELFHLFSSMGIKQNADNFHFLGGYRGEYSRLLVDLNRSADNSSLWKEPVCNLPEHDKEKILEEYYRPWRNSVEQNIEQAVQDGSFVVHLSVHSFTPVFQGEVRVTDIGLLYDPSRHTEKEFCRLWKKGLQERSFSGKIRMNSPYQGRSDGFTSALRKKYDGSQYLGIESELNQKWVQEPVFDEIILGMAESFFTVLAKFRK